MTTGGSPDPFPTANRHRLVGPPDLWEMKRRFQIGFLQQMGLQPHHWLLDLGCGTLRGGIPLIEYLDTGHYFGLEVRTEVLDEARKELAENGLTDKLPRLIHCEHLASLDLGQRFDVIWAFAVLIHMSDPILDQAARLIASHLAVGGTFYGSINRDSKRDGNWQGFPIVHRELAFYEEVFGRHRLAVTDLGSLRDFGHNHPRKSAEDQANQRMLKITRA